MSEPRPVHTPEYWKQRLAEAPDLRRAMWVENDDCWDRAEAKHRAILAREIKPTDSVLDAGCGYGRLLDLMPKEWKGNYLGIDISPELTAKAIVLHPDHHFRVNDLTSLKYMEKCAKCGWPCPAGLMLFTGQCPKCDCSSWDPFQFDVAVCMMLRHMLTAHVGIEYWQRVEKELLRVAKRLLVLEPEEVLG